MYRARRPITKDLSGKQSLGFGLEIAIGSFPQIISPKHSHKSPISQRWGIRTTNLKVVCSAPVRSARTFLESSITQWWTDELLFKGSLVQLLFAALGHFPTSLNHFEESLVIVISACQHLSFFIPLLLLMFLPSNSPNQFKPSV